MIWAVELVVAAFFGFEFTTFFTWDLLNPVERLACGIPLGCATFSWLTFAVSWGQILGSIHGLIVTSILLFLALIMMYRNSKKTVELVVTIPYYSIVIIAYSILVLVYAFHISVFDLRGDFRGTGVADIGLHLSLITSFVSGCNMNRTALSDLKTPYYSNHKLRYTVIPDYHSAILIATGGADLRTSLIVDGYLLSFSIIIGVYSLAREFSESHAVAALAVFIFMHQGGLGFLDYFRPLGRNESRDWIHRWKWRDNFWFHSVLNMIVPQRSALWSFPLVYWTLVILIHSKSSYSSYILAGFLTCLLPQIQAHSYLALAQFSIVYCLVTFKWRENWLPQIGKWACFGIPAISLAIPQTLLLLDRVSGSSFMRFCFIWKAIPGTTSFLQMWIDALGAFVVLAMVVGWFILSKVQILSYIPSAVVWILCNFVKYQPWELDNTKVLHGGWFPLALCVVSCTIVKLCRLSRGVAVILFTLTTFSSYMAFGHFVSDVYNVYTPEDFTLGEWLAENCDINAVYFAEQWGNSPVHALAGRETFMAWDAWALSHGLGDVGQRTEESDIMCEWAYEREYFDRYNVKYAVLRKGFRQCPFHGSGEFWQRIFESEKYIVYKKCL